MTDNIITSTMNTCYRCGYDLRGFADEQACPECGLLTQRSRRVSDELHDTRPRWLRNLFRGVVLVLLALFMPILGSILAVVTGQLFGGFGMWNFLPHLMLAGPDLAGIILFCGVLLLTGPEGYPPADQADRRSRMFLRQIALLPALVMLVLHLQIATRGVGWLPYQTGSWTIPTLLFVLCSALPLFLFLRLRVLAVRARSPHLAEHCKIVGIGASAAALYVMVTIVVFNNSRNVGLDEDWPSRSNIALLMMTLLGTAGMLFILWSTYLLVRFAFAFWLASRKLKRTWSRDDRSLAVEPHV